LSDAILLGILFYEASTSTVTPFQITDDNIALVPVEWTRVYRLKDWTTTRTESGVFSQKLELENDGS
jgi:hypothetical protein